MKDEECISGTRVRLKVTSGYIDGWIIAKMMGGLVDLGVRRYQVEVLGSGWVVSFVEAKDMELLT